MFVVVVQWRRHSSTDFEGASSSTRECIVQFFVRLLCCNVETELIGVSIQKSMIKKMC